MISAITALHQVDLIISSIMEQTTALRLALMDLSRTQLLSSVFSVIAIAKLV